MHCRGPLPLKAGNFQAEAAAPSPLARKRSGSKRAASDQSVSAELDYDGAPLGVGLWVARWVWGSPAS